jgi:2-polyprenyl-3-methyl-5-hydroxy-6-metoxy-1,4-benzoquinol methylase
MKNESKKVDEFWSEHDCSDSEKNFYCFPPIRSHSSKLIFNESDASRRDWCEYWTIEKYLKDKIPFENTLSICCGFGEVERTLSKLGVSKRITGIDIASGAIAEAQKRAKEEGITNIDYKVADLNDVKFNEGEYDLIWANGALHHIRELKIVIPMLYKSLKPGSYLISNEFVGPNYQRLSLRQQEIINLTLWVL